jgi:2-methylcitrate dehydratase
MRCRLTLVMKSGERHVALVDHHRGHYRNPMSESELEAKFRKLAAGVLSGLQIDRLLDKLWKLEELADAGEIVRATVIN